MIFMKYLFLISIVFIVTGCVPRISPAPGSWSALTISSEDNTVISIYPDSDTVMVKVYNTGTIFYKPKKETIDTLRVIFTKAERDSIYILAQEIIEAPPGIQHHCTDFVGDLQLVIHYGDNIKQSIDYSGVCNWNVLSDKTMALHDILKRKMKKVFLGEDDAGRSHTGN